jgi:hypothetical protein
LAWSIAAKASSRISTIRFCSGSGGSGISISLTSDKFTLGLVAPAIFSVNCEMGESVFKKYSKNLESITCYSGRIRTISAVIIPDLKLLGIIHVFPIGMPSFASAISPDIKE